MVRADPEGNEFCALTPVELTDNDQLSESCDCAHKEILDPIRPIEIHDGAVARLDLNARLPLLRICDEPADVPPRICHPSRLGLIGKTEPLCEVGRQQDGEIQAAVADIDVAWP